MRMGLDFGGTKIEAALIGGDGAMLARARLPTPDGYAAAIDAIQALRREVESLAGARARTCGAGIPGSPSPVSGLVRNANTGFLNGRAFGEDLARALDLPVRVANDANCFALSEAADGAAADADTAFGVIAGTGCGGGLVVNKRVLAGKNGVAGEWGHMPLPWARADESPAPACWCGRSGCLELWISGSGFRRWAGMACEEAAVRAKLGDVEAQAALEALFDRMARGLALVIDVADPDVIVFGGGLSNLDSLYPAVAARLPAYVFSDVVATRLVRNVHGDSSGVRGAAWLFHAEEAA